MTIFLLLIFSLGVNTFLIAAAVAFDSWIAAIMALGFLMICWKFRQVTTVVPYGLAVIIAVGMVGVTTGTLASFLHLLGLL